jgi:hypothetical protein
VAPYGTEVEHCSSGGTAHSARPQQAVPRTFAGVGRTGPGAFGRGRSVLSGPAGRTVVPQRGSGEGRRGVHDASDGVQGIQSMQVGQAEERFGADDDREIVFELGQCGGVGGPEGPGPGGTARG